MIQELKDSPNTMVGFVVRDEVTKDDFDKIILPAISELVKRTDKLNYLLVLDTPLKNFKIGDWMREAMLVLNNINKWNRAAIVTDAEDSKSFSELFGNVVPGEFKGFTHNELDRAISWAAEEIGIVHTQVFQEEADSKE